MDMARRGEGKAIFDFIRTDFPDVRSNPNTWLPPIEEPGGLVLEHGIEHGERRALACALLVLLGAAGCSCEGDGGPPELVVSLARPLAGSENVSLAIMKDGAFVEHKDFNAAAGSDAALRAPIRRGKYVVSLRRRPAETGSRRCEEATVSFEVADEATPIEVAMPPDCDSTSTLRRGGEVIAGLGLQGTQAREEDGCGQIDVRLDVAPASVPDGLVRTDVVVAPSGARISARTLLGGRRQITADTAGPYELSASIHPDPTTRLTARMRLEIPEIRGGPCGVRNTVPTLDDRFTTISISAPEFAGIHREGESWVISLSADHPAARAAAVEAASRVMRIREAELAVASFRTVKYSWGYYHAQRNASRPLLARPGVLALDSDEVANRVTIRVGEAADIAALTEELGARGVDLETVRFLASKMMEPRIGPNELHSVIGGGLQVRGEGKGNCSAGFVADSAGWPGFMTASHCSGPFGTVDGPDYYHAGKRLGWQYLISVPFAGGECPDDCECLYTDATFISFSDALYEHGRIYYTDDDVGDTHPTDIVTWSIGVCGDLVVKSGRTTLTTYGEIIDTCEDVNIDPDKLRSVNGSPVLLLCQDRVEGESLGGDSGSPVYKRVNAGVSSPPRAEEGILGILVAGTDEEYSYSLMMLMVPSFALTNVFDGNEAPRVSILEPSQTFHLSPFPVDFTAEVVDGDGFGCCTLDWTLDGVPVGSGGTEVSVHLGPTLSIIGVTATDDQGAQGYDEIFLFGINDPPTASIVKPLAGQQVWRNTPVVLEGTAYDSQTWGVPDPSWTTWGSSRAGDPFPVSGYSAVVTFTTLGARTVTFSVDDGYGETGDDSVQVTVIDPPPDAPPMVTILSPTLAGGDSAQVNGSLDLIGVVSVAGPAEMIEYRWIYEASGLDPIVVHEGTASTGVPFPYHWYASDEVPFHCGGWSGILRLEIETQSGDDASASIPLRVHQPVC